MKAVVAGEMMDTLDSQRPLTLFAPSNDAFDALPEKTLASLLRPDGKAAVVDLLKRHMVAATLMFDDLGPSQEIESMQGAMLLVKTRRVDTAKEMTVNGVSVSTMDIGATNGAVHIIEGVLLPPTPVPTSAPTAQPTAAPTAAPTPERRLGQPLPSCVETVECWGENGSDERQACDAGNAFVLLKAELFENTTYRCDVFEHETGSECDPRDMEQDAEGVWQNDCLLPGEGAWSKVVQIKEVNCTFQEFVKYMEDFDERIDTAVRRLDDAAANQSAAVIEGPLRKAVEDLLGSIDAVASRSSCSYMSPLYQDLVEGLCHQAVAGLSVIGYLYVASGLTVGLLVLAMYTMWRSEAQARTACGQDRSGEEAA